MTDERFERDLTDLLRDVSGHEAPAALRDRVARILDEAPVSPRVWFATPLRLSLAAVTVVAVIAMAIMLRQPPQVGPLPSASPGPSPSGAATEPAASPTSTPAATPTSTPSPTPAVAWTGLNWSDPVIGPATNKGRVTVNDIVDLADGYVGVGAVTGNDNTWASAFLTSPDGMHWTIAQLGESTPAPGPEDDNVTLTHVIRTGDGLLAVGATRSAWHVVPKLWRSTDGRTWTLVDSPTWREAWDPMSNNQGRIVTVASAPAGIVALGTRGPGCCAAPDAGPIIVTSTDGQIWRRLELASVFDHAHVSDLTTHDGTFVMVGGIGDYHWDADHTNLIGVSRPAVWTSIDGRSWTAASVEGEEGAGAGLGDVVAGSDGLFAVGRRAGAPAAVLVGDRVNATSGWASSDGLTWHLVGDLGKELPDIDRMAGDGSRMVIFGRDSCKATALKAWTSTGGATWTPLPFSGSTSRPTIAGPICQDDGTEGWDSGGVTLGFVVVLHHGVLVNGWSSAPAGPYFWFASAGGS